MKESSSASAYRIFDEMEHTGAAKGRPPWPPLGLFFLTVLFAPLGAMLFGINWGRLGFPEKRLAVFAAGVLALVLPIAIVAGALVMNFSLDLTTWRPVASFLALVIAYWQLLAQKPSYDAHLFGGGERASTLGLWLCAVIGVLFFVGAAFIRGAR